MADDIELRHLRYFIALAEDLSFTRAAARLHIAQPALSQQIRQLEQRIGATLLLRTPRVSLTPAGAELAAAARHTLAHVQQAAETARRVAVGSRAVIHVGLASSAALTRIPAIVKRFMDTHPDAEVRLREMHSAEQVEALKQGALDVAILREAVTDATFASHELLREPPSLIVSASHRLARVRRLDLSQCASEPFILFARRTAPTLFDQIINVCRESGFAPRIVHQAEEWHTIASLVAAGLGISIGPYGVGGLGIQGMVVRPLPTAAGRAVLFVCYPKESMSEEVRRFVQFARSEAARRASSATRLATSSSV